MPTRCARPASHLDACLPAPPPKTSRISASPFDMPMSHHPITDPAMACDAALSSRPDAAEVDEVGLAFALVVSDIVRTLLVLVSRLFPGRRETFAPASTISTFFSSTCT